MLLKIRYCWLLYLLVNDVVRMAILSKYEEHYLSPLHTVCERFFVQLGNHLFVL